jgi:hypothetical protein
MSQKRKMGKIIKNHDEIDDEILIEEVNEIFRDHPDEQIERLEDLGFEYFDDDMFDEDTEENEAYPENQNQRDLVDFFEGRKKLSEKILNDFLDEKASDDRNDPLIRKYFRKANKNLKALLIYGIDKYPARIDLLSDLAFFHEFENVLTLLIKYFTEACIKQGNLETFTDLAKEFYYSTHPNGYDAYYALQEIFEPGTEKRRVVDSLISERRQIEKESASPVKIKTKLS